MAERNLPQLHEHLRRFVHDQCYPELELGDDLPLAACPDLPLNTSISVFHSATATFYAPSELAGPGGMHREFIRCSPRWYGLRPRYDTVLIRTDNDAFGMLGMAVSRVRVFISFIHNYIRYNAAVVEWFELDGDVPDPVTGMWVVRPEHEHGKRVMGVVPLHSIIRACHLIGYYDRTHMPTNFHYADTLDAFRRFYLNWFVDYHAHETII